MLSVSILDLKEPKQIEISKLCDLNIDLIHLDVMDGIFVENKTVDFISHASIVKSINKPLDIHLMVSDVKRYIDDYSMLNPVYITFHFEAVSDVRSIINYIKKLGIKVGMAIRPTTRVDEIVEYLPYLDLILVMSVEPGRGGQKFIEGTSKKIEQLSELRKSKKYNYKIEVDGGINDLTVDFCKFADLVVVGSYITKNDYETSINTIKSKLVLDK